MAHLSPLMGRESLPLELCYRNLMRGQTWKKGWVNRRRLASQTKWKLKKFLLYISLLILPLTVASASNSLLDCACAYYVYILILNAYSCSFLDSDSFTHSDEPSDFSKCYLS
ncbi:hypothetical protein AAZX31_20G203500 [Glycine max]|uniref:Uncharacterized protein n=1 Tax=Glycine max TaxID=3847 RepID=A0A0R0EQT8_SOYBN|nr:hypothetical protein JHK86_056935 [Glycine max]KAG4919678.1 hypothetical protein JHK85_057959 [Glycine max]KAG5075763.1 hypothetical protein JHK84_056994 [Glycine max]KAG5078406.1 hypothetical protein JHK82_057101 [Glycine max]KAH1037313.1 hypothetical protein GYH30_056626 [Glycine max]